MSTPMESRRAHHGIAVVATCVAFVAGIVASSSGWLGGARVALAQPQAPGDEKPKSAAVRKAVDGGLNPAEQRAEMIRLLRSIDRRLETIATIAETTK